MTSLIKSVAEEVVQKYADQFQQKPAHDEYYSLGEDNFATPPTQHIESTPIRKKEEGNAASVDKKKLNSILKRQGLEFKTDKIIFPAGGKKKNEYAQSTLDRVYNYLFDVNDRVRLPPNFKRFAENVIDSWKGDEKHFSEAIKKYPNLKHFVSSKEDPLLKWETM